jgi:hypothetical protein
MPAPYTPRTGDPIRAQWGADLVEWILREVRPKGDGKTTKVSPNGTVSAYSRQTTEDLFIYAADFAVTNVSPEPIEGSQEVLRALVAAGHIIIGSTLVPTLASQVDLDPETDQFINLYLDVETHGTFGYRLELEEDYPVPPPQGDAWALAQLTYAVSEGEPTVLSVKQLHFGPARATGRWVG